MAFNYQQVPFWDFVRQFDNTQHNGAGVDHAEGHPAGFPHPPPPGAHPSNNPFGTGFPFGPGGLWGQGPPPHHEGPHHHGGPGAWGGRGGRRGRHCRRRRDHEDNDHEDHEHEHTPSHSRSRSPNGEHTEGENARAGSPHGRRGHHEHHGHGPRGFGHPGRGRGGWGRGGWGARGGHRGPPPFGGPGGPGGFDMRALFETLSAHPLAQSFREWAQGQQSGETPVTEDAENSFIPPVDIFSTEKAFVLHVALPGAKKEDVGVNWDSEKGLLNLAGVVYRQGDEEFLKTLSKSERKVGVFERTVKLPPGNEEKEEIDGDAITAKLEDGVLVVTVPKIEKEWTEIKKVDIV